MAISPEDLLDPACIARIREVLTPAERAELDMLLDWEPVTFADLKILDVYGDVVDLLKNPPQMALLEFLGIDPNDPYPSIEGALWRIRLLKARRVGFTTIIMAIFFLNVYNRKERFAVSVAHDQKGADTIFQIVERFYRLLPAKKKIKAGRANTRELFWPSTNSRMLALTAGTDNLMSGATLHYVHKSERAKWKGTKEQIAALDASLNIAARWGNIVEETTAQGLNHFYEDWNASVAGTSQYRAFFMPWWRDPRNVAPVPVDFVRTKDEVKRAAAFGLSDEQLAWHRIQAEDLGDLVKQEYPDTPEEAFIASGNPRFNRVWLFDYLRRIQPSGYAEGWEPERVEVMETTSWTGTFTVYVEPEEKRKYIATVDTAKGLTEGGDPDYSVCHVYDLDTHEQVAHYRARNETHDYAIDLSIIGTMYNRCMMVVELPGPGAEVLETLINQCHYRQIYFYDDPLDLDPSGTKKRKPGFIMTESTKQESESALASLIQANVTIDDANETGLYVRPLDITFRHPNTIMELIHYIKITRSKCGAEAGGHDDECTCARLFAAVLPVFSTRGKVPAPPAARKPARYGNTSKLRRG